jgi:hypothetical protein
MIELLEDIRFLEIGSIRAIKQHRALLAGLHGISDPLDKHLHLLSWRESQVPARLAVGGVNGQLDQVFLEGVEIQVRAVLPLEDLVVEGPKQGLVLLFRHIGGQPVVLQELVALGWTQVLGALHHVLENALGVAGSARGVA